MSGRLWTGIRRVTPPGRRTPSLAKGIMGMSLCFGEATILVGTIKDDWYLRSSMYWNSG